MQSARQSISFAVARKRIPLHQADPPISLRSLAAILGLERQFAASSLFTLLNLPGNFRPGQQLATTAEAGVTNSWYQTDVFGVGLDASLWKFWEYNDGAWLNGVVAGIGELSASAPLVASAAGGSLLGGRNVVIQLFAPSISEQGVAAFNQDVDGKWQPVFLPLQTEVPLTAFLSPVASEGLNAIVAVDSSGTVQLFHQPDPETPFGELQAEPISGPNFAPAGAPTAIDYRMVSFGSGPLNVFVVSNEGELWAFARNDDDQTWTSLRMPNANGVKLVPGSYVATGYQVAYEQTGAGSHSLGYSQLNVFVIDAAGSLQMWWESQGSEWSQQILQPANTLVPGAPIGTGRQVFSVEYTNGVIGDQLDVFSVDPKGRLLRWWVYQSGGWSQDVIPSEQSLPPGAHICTANQGVDSNRAFHQLDVFLVGFDGRIVMFSQWDENAWAYQIIPGSDLPVPPTTI